MKVLWEVSAAECLCSGQYEKVGFPLLPRKLKTAVKFHYYTYPRKNDHECFTHFAFVHLLFFQVGKCDWFCYGELIFLWSIFRRGRCFWKGKITPKLRSTTHPTSFNSVVRFVWSRILVEKVRSFLYLIVLNMELHCYVNVCPKLLKRQSKHASMPVKGNNHEIRHPNSTSNHNRKPMET